VRRAATRHHGGLAAEAIAERLYLADGGRVLARRWRGPGGEIDLVVELAGLVVFVEVKARRTRDGAAEALRPAQAARIAASAEAFLAGRGGGDARVDVVLVDGEGRPERIENALGF
jgi:putative endonuclease